MAERDDLIGIVGAGNVSDDPHVLASYAQDYSLAEPKTPGWVIFVTQSEQVQQVVRYAESRKIPLTPKSSSVGFHGEGLPVSGGIVIDMTRMNHIIEIDSDNKRVLLEPGVTFRQLQPVLAKEGMQVCNPLLTHPSKSVLTSSLEREPILIPKPEYNDTLCTFGIVIGNGELIRTGSALGTGITSGIYPDGLYPGSALYKGAQGTLGILTWANIKVEWLPQLDKTFCFGFDSPETFIEPLYAIQRRQIGRECLVLNRLHFAAMISEDDQSIEALRRKLPPYVMIIILSGGDILPQEKIDYEEEALLHIISDEKMINFYDIDNGHLLPMSIPAILRNSSPPNRVFWKHRYKGASYDIFFYTTIEQAPAFSRMIVSISHKHAFSEDDIGFYFQPVEYGRVAFCQYSFNCDPHDQKKLERVQSLFNEASEKAMDMGAFFSTPYGVWSPMVYRRAGDYHQNLKIIKDAFDPSGILNPGRLCF